MTDPRLVDTIVYLMFEDRSFDHMLGHLSYDLGRDVNGLHRPLERSDYENRFGSKSFFPFEAGDKWLPGDAPHARERIAVQLAKSGNGHSMNGFARSYFEYAQERGFEIPDPTEPEVMGFQRPGAVPITTFLANEFAVCDQWFAPLPTSTQPNKLMFFAGNSRIDSTSDILPPGSGDPFVIDWLRARKVHHP